MASDGASLNQAQIALLNYCSRADSIAYELEDIETSSAIELREEELLSML